MMQAPDQPELPLETEEEQLSELVNLWEYMLKSKPWMEYENAINEQIAARRQHNETLGLNGGLDDMVDGYARRAEISALSLAIKLPRARLEVLKQDLKMVREGIELNDLDQRGEMDLPPSIYDTEPQLGYGAP